MRLPSTPRITLARDLRAEVVHNYSRGRVIIAVDGIGGAGTREWADDLAAVFDEAGTPAFRASIDDFHRPRAERYRRGPTSALGYYEDSFDYSLFRRVLIEPFRMAGSAGFQLQGFDEERDLSEQARWTTAPQDAVLIVDGVFLHRPVLRGLWHYSLWIEATLQNSYARLAASVGVNPDPEAPENARYIDGQRLYVNEASPRTVASAVVDNNHPDEPRRLYLDSC